MWKDEDLIADTHQRASDELDREVDDEAYDAMRDEGFLRPPRGRLKIDYEIDRRMRHKPW